MKNLLHKASDWIKDKDTISKPVTEKLHFDSNKQTKTLFGGCTTILMLLFILLIGVVKYISVSQRDKIYREIKHEDYDGKDVPVSVLK